MLMGNFYHVTFNFVKVLSVPRRTNTFNLEIAWNKQIYSFMKIMKNSSTKKQIPGPDRINAYSIY